MIEKTTFSKKELQIELNKKYGIKVEKIEKINKGTANIFKIISNNEKFIVKEFQSKYSKENVLKEIKKRKLKAKIVLQVHDEMMIEVPLKEVEEVKDLLKTGMESACKLNVPLLAEVSEATNWYDCK